MHHLTLELNAQNGSLVRILSMTQRRGWEPMEILTTRMGNAMTLELTVFGERPIELLVRQLSKLYDVNTVEVNS